MNLKARTYDAQVSAARDEVQRSLIEVRRGLADVEQSADHPTARAGMTLAADATELALRLGVLAALLEAAPLIDRED